MQQLRAQRYPKIDWKQTASSTKELNSLDCKITPFQQQFLLGNNTTEIQDCVEEFKNYLDEQTPSAGLKQQQIYFI